MSKKGIIPFQEKRNRNYVTPNNTQNDSEERKVLFSFEILDRREYFDLDGTCVNWASELIDTLKKLSKITMREIHSGIYGGKSSTFGIHSIADASPPYPLPEGVSLEDCYQIRISANKGRIHGRFVENVFYIIWLDPQHNLFPSKDRGGRKKIIPPSTCCKERDEELIKLREEIAVYRELYEKE